MIIDFHTHVLPGIDDGARDVDTSLKMLKASAEQGVEWMVATPHFYATRDCVDDFLDKRQRAWEKLNASLPPAHPGIVLGAEVAFFRGIGGADRLDALKIQGTDCILLEMPFGEWSREDVDEVSRLIEDRGFKVILAHLERYMTMRENADHVKRLMEMPLKVQINAEALLDWRQRGRIAKLFKNGQAHLMGSDCHGMGHRPPNLLSGRGALQKKLGQECLETIDRLSERLLLG